MLTVRESFERFNEFIETQYRERFGARERYYLRSGSLITASAR
ncbi:MAG: hypothetical protein ABSB29_09760 [Nitrososphaerales archaeon]|jgi:hypothetical protein